MFQQFSLQRPAAAPTALPGGAAAAQNPMGLVFGQSAATTAATTSTLTATKPAAATAATATTTPTLFSAFGVPAQTAASSTAAPLSFFSSATLAASAAAPSPAGITTTGLGTFGSLSRSNAVDVATGAEDAIRSAYDAWNPQSPYCQFKHYFYNLVHPSEVKHYTRDPQEDERLYEHAVLNNPNPSCLVPVLAKGFTDVESRMREQEAYIKNLMYRLAEISITCEKLRRRHDVDSCARLTELARRHKELAARCVRLMLHIHVLRCKNLPLTLEEESLAAKISDLTARLRGPSGCLARVSALWDSLGSLSPSFAYRNGDAGNPHTSAAAASSYPSGPSAHSSAGNLPAEYVSRLMMALQKQQDGMLHVANVLKCDKHDLDTILKTLRHESERNYRNLLMSPSSSSPAAYPPPS